jgi:hypothetical protein
MAMQATIVRPGRAAFRQELSDGLLIAERNLRRIPRIPELAIFATLQSIVFVLLLAFVFGGAIPLPVAARTASTSYRGSLRRRSSSLPPPRPSASGRISARGSSTAFARFRWPAARR